MIPIKLGASDAEKCWITNSDMDLAAAMRSACAEVINGKGDIAALRNGLDIVRKFDLIDIDTSKLETKNLFPVCYPIPSSIKEILSEGASSAGFHAVSTFYECPEKSRLKAIKCKPKVQRDFEPGIEMGALPYGSIIHALLAIRVVHGQGVAMALLDNDGAIGKDLHEMDRIKCMNVLLTYDENWPLERENFEYIGVETSVVTNFGTESSPIYRTARFDKLVRYDGQVYSLEHKTASRGGVGAMLTYTPQFWVQVAIWNANPSLVEKFGPMRGVIPDVIVKSAIPKCERPGVRTVNKRHEALALEYMTAVNAIKWPKSHIGEDSFVRSISSCYSKWGPCEYLELCHDGAEGAYTFGE